MQPRVEHLAYPLDGSLLIQQWTARELQFGWHLHPEAELTWVDGGRGLRYVGNHVESYGPDELVLLAPNLPHTWTGESTEPGNRIEATVVQFLPGRLLGTDPIPELSGIVELFKQAEAGLVFGPATRADVEKLRRRLLEASGVERLTLLLDLLNRLAGAGDARPLASQSLRVSRKDQRMEKVLAYLNDHFAEPITLDDLAGLSSMSRSAFCRYFRRATGTGFVDYLTSLRLGHACSLLRETEEPVTAICYESGFGNLSNFNRRFRSRHGVTPSQYRGRWRGGEISPVGKSGGVLTG